MTKTVPRALGRNLAPYSGELAEFICKMLREAAAH